jgi:hypothetical protein
LELFKLSGNKKIVITCLFLLFELFKNIDMSVLVVGASGATGQKLVEQLVLMNDKVKVIVRAPDKLPKSWFENPKIEIFKASVSELNKETIAEYLKDCNAVASCLGHNISRKGIFGQPHLLVTNAVKKICETILKTKTNKPIRFVLMSTVAYRNPDLDEPVSIAHKMVIGLLRLFLPPHVDNEKAADYLRINIGQTNDAIEWCAVRPSGLINEYKFSEYEIFSAPIRSPIFDDGKVSRINVGNFMARLISEKEIWEKWKGQMPVVYNKT